MNLSEMIKNNLPLAVAGFVVSGFLTGFGAGFALKGELVSWRVELLSDKVSSFQKEIDKKDTVVSQRTNEVEVLNKKLREFESRDNSQQATIKDLQESSREKDKQAVAQKNEHQSKITSLEEQLQEVRSQGERLCEDPQTSMEEIKQRIILTSHRKGKGNRVERCFDASGIFTEPFGRYSMFVITKVKGNEYWPHPVELDMRDRTWKATGVCVDRSIERRGDTVTLIVVLVGESGKKLFDYYLKVAKQTDRWIGIDEFPSDYVECQRVELVVSSKHSGNSRHTIPIL